jgi:hypothetical protein
VKAAQELEHPRITPAGRAKRTAIPTAGQQPTKISAIGYLSPSSSDAPTVATALFSALSKIGMN